MTTFNALYLTATPFEFKGTREALKELVHQKFDVPNGSYLQATDLYGRRVLVMKGPHSNIVVYDRYPDGLVPMFLFHAKPDIGKKLPPVLRNEDMAYLKDIVYVA